MIAFLFAAKVHIFMDSLPDIIDHICFVRVLWKIKGWFCVASNLLVPQHKCVPFQHYININTVQCRRRGYYTAIAKAYLLYLHVTKFLSVVIFCTYTVLLIIMHCFTINPLSPREVSNNIQIFKVCQNIRYTFFGQLLTTLLLFLIWAETFLRNLYFAFRSMSYIRTPSLKIIRIKNMTGSKRVKSSQVYLNTIISSLLVCLKQISESD